MRRVTEIQKERTYSEKRQNGGRKKRKKSKNYIQRERNSKVKKDTVEWDIECEENIIGVKETKKNKKK